MWSVHSYLSDTIPVLLVIFKSSPSYVEVQRVWVGYAQWVEWVPVVAWLWYLHLGASCRHASGKTRNVCVFTFQVCSHCCFRAFVCFIVLFSALFSTLKSVILLLQIYYKCPIVSVRVSVTKVTENGYLSVIRIAFGIYTAWSEFFQCFHSANVSESVMCTSKGKNWDSSETASLPQLSP